MASTAELPDDFDSESLAEKYRDDDRIDEAEESDFPLMAGMIVDAIMHLDGRMGVYDTISTLSGLLAYVDEKQGYRTSVEVTERSDIDGRITGWSMKRVPVAEAE